MADEAQVIPPPRRRQATMIRNLIPRLPERGHIKIGALGETRKSKGGNEYQLPQKLDHFRVTTLMRGKDGNFVVDREIHEALGDQPTDIPIRLLYDDLSLNFPTRYACYVGKTLWCSGDGVEATRISARPDDKKPLSEPLTVQCPCPRQDPSYKGQDRCKMNGRLSVLIEGAGGVGGVWVFRTTSYNSITGIMSSLAFLRQVTSGILANIPLKLVIRPKQATNPTDQSSVLIYVVSVEFPGDIAQLQQIGHQVALDRATTHVSIANIEEEARRLLELPGPADAALPGDVPEDIVAEFYPEQQEDIPPRPTREQFVETPHDKETGEIIENEPVREVDEVDLMQRAVTAAAGGTKAFLDFWSDLPKGGPEREALRPDVKKYENIAKKADAKLDIASAHAREGDPGEEDQERVLAEDQAEQEGRYDQEEPGADEPDEPREPDEPIVKEPDAPVPQQEPPKDVARATERKLTFSNDVRADIWDLDSYKVEMPLRPNSNAPNWQIWRDQLMNLAQQASTIAEMEKFEEDNQDAFAKIGDAFPNYLLQIKKVIIQRRAELEGA